MKTLARLLLPCLVAGCATPVPQPPPPTTIRASDSNVGMPTVRIANESNTQSRDPSDVGMGGALELSYLGGRGSDTQTLAGNAQPIRLGGASFGAPGEVRHDFRLDWYEIDLRSRIFSPDADRHLGVEFLFGAAFPRLNFQVSSPAQTASETFGGGGPVLGIGGLWRFRPGTYAHGRYSYYYGAGGNEDFRHAKRMELYLGHALTKNVVVRAGYVSWSIEIKRNDLRFSDLDVQMRGPSLGLDLVF